MYQQSFVLPKTYRIKLRNVMVILVGFFISFACIPLVIWLKSHVSFPLWPVLLLFDLFMLFLVCVGIGSRLVLSDAGLTFYMLGARVFTPWSNIAGIRTTRVGVGTWRISRVMLAKPAVKRSKKATGMCEGMAVITGKRWLLALGISMSGSGMNSLPMLDSWYRDEIEAYLRLYAPQAFEHVSLDVDEHIVSYSVTYSNLRQMVQPQAFAADSLSVPKVYRAHILDILVPILLGIGLAALAIFMLVFYSVGVDNLFASLFVLLLALCCFLGYFQQRNCRMVVSAEGLTYYDCDHSMFTPWQNIVGFGFIKGQRRTRGLILREAAIMKMSLVDGMQQGVAVLDTRWWSQPLGSRKRFFVMSSSFCERDWEHGELGMYLRRYAPQMFVSAMGSLPPTNDFIGGKQGVHLPGM